VASTLGLTIHSENVLAGLAAYLRDKEMLIVLDSCKHIIDAAAVLAEQIIGGATGVHILATSREPLRAKAERVHRMPPLASPPSPPGLTAAEALAFPAVQLFVERASESLENFELSDAGASVVAEICRRLEGIALAIELAATRVDSLGVHELSALVGDRFWLLRQGRRTALSRHRTLAAALIGATNSCPRPNVQSCAGFPCSRVRSHWTLQPRSSPDQESLAPKLSRASQT
jgi:predicted ATPase